MNFNTMLKHRGHVARLFAASVGLSAALHLVDPCPAIAQTNPSVPPKALETFYETAFIERPETEPYVVKWIKPVRVGLLGDDSNEYQSLLATLSRSLAAATSLDIQFARKDVNYVVIISDDIFGDILGRYRNAIRPLFVSDEEFLRHVDELGRRGDKCFFSVGFYRRQIQGVVIVAARDLPPPQTKKCVLSHFVSGFGMLNLHKIKAESIVNYPDRTLLGSEMGISEYDKQFFSILYQPEVLPGMRKDEVLRTLSGSGGVRK